MPVYKYKFTLKKSISDLGLKYGLLLVIITFKLQRFCGYLSKDLKVMRINLCEKSKNPFE